MTKELFKFAGAVLDCYDDPAFIDSVQAKACFDKHLVAPEKVDDLPDESFAVKIASRSGYRRRFPIYNEAATKVSCHYFDLNYDDLPEEIQKSAGYHIAAACDKFGISLSENIQKHASAPADFRVEQVTARRSEPLIGLDQLTKMAEERLATELPKMRPENRVKAATSFYKSAGTVGRQDIWDYVEKPVAGPMLEGALDDRAEIMKSASAEMRALFDEVRSQIDELPISEAIASLESFDKYAGLRERYSQGLIDPQLAAFGGWRTPKFREELAEFEQSKVAEIMDGQTGQRVDPETARGMSMEKHLNNMQQRYPKGSESFKKAQAAGISDDMEQKYGPNYIKARKLHFSS